MFETVIVGVDGREGGRAAVALARWLAPEGGLVLLTAYPYDVGPPDRLASHPSRASLREAAEALLEQAGGEGAGVAELVAVADTSPARALHRAAEERDADLIAVGFAHHGPVGRVVLGDVARATLHDAPCPVAVAPRGHRPGPLATIAVGFDGSPEARRALELAAELARAHGARVRLAAVVAPPVVVQPAYPSGYGVDWDEQASAERVEADRLLERAVAELGVEAEAEVLVGSPARELGALSRFVDLLVVGSRGWGPALRVLLGSTSSRLAHDSACSVLVVPRPAETGERLQAGRS
jgi:nucleotide-binding universal stress UspA family protein